MAIFQTILHPTDFDAPSLEAFRVARGLAQQLGAKVIAVHVAAPPAAVTQDGRVIFDPKEPNPVDLWANYRTAQADSPGVAVEYAVMVGKAGAATRMLWDLIGGNPDSVLVVMGTHARTGLCRMIWGSRAEEVVRKAPCAVLVVKAPPAGETGGATDLRAAVPALPQGA
jgi:universal stress protein A